MRGTCKVPLPLRTAADGVDETISKLLGGDEVDEEVDDVGAISQEIYELRNESKETKQNVLKWEKYRCVGFVFLQGYVV